MNAYDVEYVPVADLVPYEKNAKKHPRDQINRIAESIRQFGFRQNLVVDRNNVVVIGHGRLLGRELFFEYEKRGTLCTMFINMY